MVPPGLPRPAQNKVLLNWPELIVYVINFVIKRRIDRKYNCFIRSLTSFNCFTGHKPDAIQSPVII